MYWFTQPRVLWFSRASLWSILSRGQKRSGNSADRWTVLIVRELLADIPHFNELERGLPGISRSLLAERLRRLVQYGVLERHSAGRGSRTEYRLTPAGRELQLMIDVLGSGARAGPLVIRGRTNSIRSSCSGGCNVASVSIASRGGAS